MRVLWPNGWMHQDASWYGVGLGQSDIVLDGAPAPPTQRGTAALSNFFGPFYCGQTVGWIRMPLSTEVGLGPGNIVLNGDTACPPWKRA